MKEENFSRRKFLTSLGALSGGLLLSACTSSKPSSTTTSTTSTTIAPNNFTSLNYAALMTSIENLLIYTYSSLKAQASNFAIPSCILALMDAAVVDHQDHANNWNNFLQQNHQKPISSLDPSLHSVLDAQMAALPKHSAVNFQNKAMTIASQLEQVCAATYQNCIKFKLPASVINLSVRTQGIELQHIAILEFFLGQYPVIGTFSTTNGARPLADYNGSF